MEPLSEGAVWVLNGVNVRNAFCWYFVQSITINFVRLHNILDLFIFVNCMTLDLTSKMQVLFLYISKTLCSLKTTCARFFSDTVVLSSGDDFG